MDVAGGKREILFATESHTGAKTPCFYEVDEQNVWHPIAYIVPVGRAKTNKEFFKEIVESIAQSFISLTNGRNN